MSWPCPVWCIAFQAVFSNERYSVGATGTVDPLVVCGPRSVPKFGSFQNDQNRTAGNGLRRAGRAEVAVVALGHRVHELPVQRGVGPPAVVAEF